MEARNVESHLQIPSYRARKIADAYDIRPGRDIYWVPSGEVIRVIPPGKQAEAQDRKSKLRLFDQATERHRRRALAARVAGKPRSRGWRREDLNLRGRSR